MADARKFPPAVALTRMVSGFQLPRALQVAARLKLGRYIRESPRSAEDLASALGLHARTLHRLLRFLSEHGVFEEREAGIFGPTELSDHLNLVDSIFSGVESWAAWEALSEALRTGRPTFETANGAPFFEYAASHPEQNQNWNDWNSATGGSWLPPVVSALGLKGFETVVDVGGGQGNLLIEILTRYPSCRGVLVDLPAVIEGAQSHLERAGVLDRCTLVPGDAFVRIPTGGDVYTVCRVLLNWDDDGAVSLLRSCNRAAGAQARLLLVDLLLPEKGDPQRPMLARNDLNLFLMQGGGHRTREEMASLFSAAGLELVGVIPAASPHASGWWQVIEGRQLRAA